MNVNDAFYHGVRHQVRRVLTAMGPERVEKALTAFDNGTPGSWAACFLARGFEDDAEWDRGNPEKSIQQILKLESHVPIRIVWNLFDQYSSYSQMDGGKMQMTTKEYRSFIEGFLDESRDPEVLNLLRNLGNSVDLTHLDARKIEAICA